MKKTNFFLLGIIAVILFSCDAKPVKISPEKVANKLTYLQDKKTCECFAVVGVASGANIIGKAKGIGITRVPCTDKVIQQIKNKECNTK